MVAVDEAVAHVSIHELACAFELITSQVRTVFEDIANPFIMDVVSPACSEEIGEREMHQQIA